MEILVIRTHEKQNQYTCLIGIAFILSLNNYTEKVERHPSENKSNFRELKNVDILIGLNS